MLNDHKLRDKASGSAGGAPADEYVIPNVNTAHDGPKLASGRRRIEPTFVQEQPETPTNTYERILSIWERWNPEPAENKVSKEVAEQFYKDLQKVLGSDLILPSYAHLQKDEGQLLNDDDVLENHCRDLNQLAQKYIIHSEGTFQSKKTGGVYHVTPDSIEYKGDREKFGPKQAREMVQDFARRDKSMVSSDVIKLENCNKRNKIFLILAIKEYNDTAPKNMQLKHNDTKFLKKFGANKAIKEWNDFAEQNEIFYHTASPLDPEIEPEPEPEPELEAEPKPSTQKDSTQNLSKNGQAETEKTFKRKVNVANTQFDNAVHNLQEEGGSTKKENKSKKSWKEGKGIKDENIVNAEFTEVTKDKVKEEVQKNPKPNTNITTEKLPPPDFLKPRN